MAVLGFRSLRPIWKVYLLLLHTCVVALRPQTCREAHSWLDTVVSRCRCIAPTCQGAMTYKHVTSPEAHKSQWQLSDDTHACLRQIFITIFRYRYYDPQRSHSCQEREERPLVGKRHLTTWVTLSQEGISNSRFSGITLRDRRSNRRNLTSIFSNYFRFSLLLGKVYMSIGCLWGEKEARNGVVHHREMSIIWTTFFFRNVTGFVAPGETFA